MPVHCRELQFVFLCFVSCSNGGGGFSRAERVFHWRYLWQQVYCCVRKRSQKSIVGFSHTSNLDSLGLPGCEPHSGIPTPYLRLAQWEHILVCFVTRLLLYWLPRRLRVAQKGALLVTIRGNITGLFHLHSHLQGGT